MTGHVFWGNKRNGSLRVWYSGHNDFSVCFSYTLVHEALYKFYLTTFKYAFSTAEAIYYPGKGRL